MNRVEIMVASRDDLSVKFKQFMNIIREKKTPMIFEGEDGKYYSARIDAFFEQPWDSIDAGGKPKVIALREKVKANPIYKEKIALYFVDSDFEDNLDIGNQTDIYITPCYSIENLYFTEALIRNVLRDEFKISESNEESENFHLAIQRFNELKGQFLSEMKYFNHLIYYVRIVYEKSDSNSSKLNLNNVSLEDLLKVTLTSVNKVYNEREPKSIFKDLNEDIDVDLDLAENFFDTKDVEKFYRGKQNLEFMRKIIDLMKEDRNKKQNRTLFATKGNVSLNLTKGNCISELSKYADTPSCLKSFLRSYNSKE